MFIHLPLILFAPPPRLLIDFKNSKWLTYFCILLCICYCFSHLIGLLSVTWLSLLYKFTQFFIYFLFLSAEGPMLETLDCTIRIGSTPTILHFEQYYCCLFVNCCLILNFENKVSKHKIKLTELAITYCISLCETSTIVH